MTTTERVLLGPAAGDVLAAVLEPAGLRVERWGRDAVHARPGAETSVGYVVGTRPAGAPAAEPVTHHLTVTTADVDGPGVARVRVGDAALAVWAHPDDPALPALRTASTPDLLAGVLAGAGDATRVTALRTVAYRPLRRAVLAAGTDTGDRWAKVLRADRSTGLVTRLALLRGVDVPVPATVAHTPGLVVLGSAAGRPLADHLMAGDAPHPGAVLELLSRVAAVPADALPARPPWSARLEQYVAALVDHAPDLADVVRWTADAVHAAVAVTDPGPAGVTHGDLHPANLWWDGATGLGLVDVDTLGPGLLVDDLACLLAHTSVLPTLDPGYRAVPGWRDALLREADRVVDPVGLRARAAAVLLSLAASRPAEHLVRAWALLARDLVPRPVRGVPVPAPGTTERRAS
ncbi:phosphotransferase [Cellulomonas sp. JZ18]|uniref:phosphotransferase n=1 Tax=Cellulomonas sp. JZ18 TaxID=2654191 RepID=UPI0018AF7A9C|nr:phosphotransferase [Cellulomonas sp. JZ18]